MYIPSPGCKFVECDLSSAEARVDRVLSGNLDMKIFDPPGIHRVTASWIFGLRPEEIKKNILISGVDQYFIGKTARHAGERNMREDRLSLMTGLPLKDSKKVLETFHKNQPEIRGVFHKEIIEAIQRSSHCLVAPNGRRRDFFDRTDQQSVHNEAISFLPQAIVSDITKFDGVLRTLEGDLESCLIAEAHDGCLMECPSDKALALAARYKQNVESAKIDFNLCTLARDFLLSIPCECAIGESWGLMDEVKI
jgi:hypothetical protein